MKRLGALISAAALVFTVGCGQSDPGITTSVKSKLAADDMVKAYQIDVDTKDHVVTLSGAVDSTAARDRAVQIAAGTEGVRDVMNQLTLRDAAATSGIRDDIDDIDVDIDVKDDAKRGAAIVKDGAERAGEAVKDGAAKVKDGAEKLGSKVVDSVTDKDRDSDKDGH